MQPFIHWLETSFSPRMAKVNNNVWVVSIKDSIMQVLPFILVGSVFAMLAILNDYFPSLPSFWTPYGWTMGMLSLLVSFLIPFNLMEKRNFRKQRLIAGGSGTILLLIIITPQVVKDGEPGFGHAALGAGGMFVAILAGVVSGLIMSLFGGFSLFKEESVIPEFVRAWFDAMIPVGLVVTLGWVVVDLLGLDVYNAVLAVFRPLAGIIESPWGFPLMCLTYCFLYSMGISSWVLTPVTTPVLLAAIQANMAGTAENLVTSTTLFSTYLWFGGIGNTMALVLMMAASKSTRLKALGRACLPPAIVNINEPVVFGAIAWNPVLMVPMWLQGLIPPILVWLLTKTIRFAPIPMNQFELWYTPYPLATWITTRSLSAIVLMLLVFAVSAVIWYPFFKVYEHQSLLKEARDSAGSEAGRTGGPDGRSEARVASRTGGRAGASASAATRAIAPGSSAYCSPQISFSICVPALRAARAVSALNVSTETGTGHSARIVSRNGSSRSISSAALMGTNPGRLDSAPISMMSAPSRTISSIWRSALSRVFHLPPSENESGVTFRMPMTSVRPPSVSFFPSRKRYVLSAVIPFT